jgi:hypothetical protein
MVLLAPLASSLPDGLEAGMGTLSVATSEPAPGWIFAPDYQAPGVDHESLSLIAGAGVGALLVAFCGLLLAKAARRKTAPVLRHPRTRRTLSS